MKKSLVVLAAVIGICVMQSCASYTPAKLQVHSATAVTVDELNPGVRIAPFLCDYEMIPKNNPQPVYYEYNTGIKVESVTYSINAWIDTYETIVQAKMMKEHNADAILSATVEAKNNEKGELIIIVRGYPVKYTNFRPATKDDLWMVDFEKYKTGTILQGETRTGVVTDESTNTK